MSAVLEEAIGSEVCEAPFPDANGFDLAEARARIEANLDRLRQSVKQLGALCDALKDKAAEVDQAFKGVSRE